MRQAWGTIRERLGLRANPPSSTSTTTTTNPSPTSVGTPLLPAPSLPSSTTSLGLNTARERERNQALTDTREQMLAEMARAFNIGLGLGPNASTGAEEDHQQQEGGRRRSSGSSSSGENEGRQNEDSAGTGGGPWTTPTTDLPPEGSFERFLVELQSDLRVALTQEGRGEESGEQQEEGREVAQLGATEMQAETGTNASSGGEGERESAPSVRSLVPTELDDEEYPDLPPLQDPTASDSDEDDVSADGEF